ncbi:hypothetical protein ONE63_007936 [Megalurothrips usitatus]|uniref:Uncharacterized protein n=1 Tax=Megalurothrips usitatus TaxID=439358 RepID=A0AAV7XSK6_9NEOP|nr:hypothetical protein ONE63_007936 [Megalurothrips usitatus]
MPINTEEMMSVLSTLADQRNMRVAVTESMKCGIAAGVSATVFGILLGPLGIAVGGTLGSLAAAWRASGQFKSVAKVITEDMTPYQQAELAASCMRVVQDLRVEDVAVLLPLLINSSTAQQAIINQIIAYVTNEMKLKIID